MYNFFNFNIIFFHLTGLPYLEEPKFRNVAGKLFWLFCKLVGDVAIFLNTISVVTVTVMSANDLGKFFASGMAVAYNTGYYVRYILYRSKMVQIIDVYKNLNKFFDECNKKDKEFFALYERYQKLIRNISLVRSISELSGCIILCVTFAIQGLYGKTRLPSYAWFPFPQDVEPNNFFLCMFQMISFFIVVARVAASDCFFCMVITFLGLQIKVLKMNLPEIVEEKPSKLEADRWGEFKWWINGHREALRSIQIFKEVISPFLVNTYLVVLLIILFGGVITTSTETWDLYQQVTLVFTGVLNLIILFITCKTGDFLEEMQMTVADEGYEFDLFVLPKKYLTAYKLIFMRSQKLITLDAYRFHPLSSSTFGVLVRATFSYYLAIIQISQHTKSQS